MTRVKPRILSGFMELLPNDQIAFQRMLDTIRSVYERFGFTPIETPAIELTEILLAKGGGETDQQIYRIPGRGDDIALHFDLTVPLARYVAQHYGQLTFPFRRYQMQKVWRAERAQRGRFREFYQCDIDVIGSFDPIVDAEIPSVIYEVFIALGFENFTIRINNRKILGGFFASLGLAKKSNDILRMVDKLEKIGRAEVKKELIGIGARKDQVDSIIDFVAIDGNDGEVLKKLESLGINESLFRVGVDELSKVVSAIKSLGVPRDNYKIDLSIARGLDYYTGTVYETVLDDYPQIGSVCSGGRFDNLASYYTDKELPGVGISIGLTRLFYQLKEAGLIEAGVSVPTRVLVVKTDGKYLDYCLQVAAKLRKSGVNTEVYFENDKLSKQFKYAGKLGIGNVLIVGEEEVSQGTVTWRNMETGEQKVINASSVTSEIK